MVLRTNSTCSSGVVGLGALGTSRSLLSQETAEGTGDSGSLFSLRPKNENNSSTPESRLGVALVTGKFLKTVGN